MRPTARQTTSGPARGTGIALTESQKLDWLRLIRTESVGPRTFRAMLNRHGGAGAALEALPGLSLARLGKRIQPFARDEAEREWAALMALGGRFVAIGEPGYPAILAAADDAPPLISVIGRKDVLLMPSIAIVGSRNASFAGQKMAERLANELGAAGFSIVSGLARGIDTAAHKAALSTGTAAILAGGLERPYPPENLDLFARIGMEGAVLSEMPLRWEPRGRDFPRRNRIISGLCYATIIVEAAPKSGSLITARFANEQGREVFAVPGSPLDPRAEGANDLIYKGEARICRSAEDVIEAVSPMLEIGAPRKVDLFAETQAGERWRLWDEWPDGGAGDGSLIAPEPEVDASEDMLEEPTRGFDGPMLRKTLLEQISAAPILIDDVARLADAPVQTVRGMLFELEIEGLVRLDQAGTVRRG